MAKVQVWGKNGRKYQQFADHITIGLYRNQIFAYLDGVRSFAVRNSFAEAILEGKRIACPNVGTLPLEDKNATFQIAVRSPDLDFEEWYLAYASVFCNHCSFEDFSNFNLHEYRTKGVDGLYVRVHPWRDTFQGKHSFREVFEVSWENGNLSLAPTPGTLIFWIKGRHFRRGGGLRAALEQFPKADVLVPYGSLLILHDLSQ